MDTLTCSLQICFQIAYILTSTKAYYKDHFKTASSKQTVALSENSLASGYMEGKTQET
jgi:hypothetical protein